MKLSNKTLSRLIHGACNVKEIDGYLAPYRFTDAQIEYFTFNEFYYDRTKFGASVSIEFITDATAISFSYCAKNIATHDSIDVCVDGKLFSVTPTDSILPKGRLEFSLPAGNKTVAVYLSVDAEFHIKEFSIEGKWRSAIKSRPRVLFLGDSITQGYGSKIGSQTFASLTARTLGWEILNQGLGGYYHDKNVIADLAPYRPDKIVVAMGTNDLLRANANELISSFYETLRARYPETPILTVTPLWRGDDPHRLPILEAQRSFIYETCARYNGITVVNGYELVPHISGCFLDDLHPNAWGMELYAARLTAKIKQIKF